ncbi:MAG: response regulator [Rhodobacteraceae bacterium]|nr:MAG: response regulator [Paracoccaceae bacterium]
MSLEYFGGMTVTQFRSGRDALDKIDGVGVDLLLLDVMMPDMDGLSLFRRLRGVPGLEDVPAVFMTAKAEQLDPAAAREEGVLGVIAKPFDTVALPATIRALWSGGTQEAGRG